MARSSRRASVEVPGLRRLTRDLRQLGDDLGDLKDAAQRAGMIVVTAAASRAPRSTGRLAGSGRAARAAGRVSVMYGSASVPYAGPIHYGWPDRGIDPQPFVTDAAQATESQWLDVYTEAIDNAVDEVAGKTYR